MSIYYLIQYIIILPIYYLTQGETWSADCSSLGPACHQVPPQVDYLRIDDSIFIVMISIVIITIVINVLIVLIVIIDHGIMIRRAQAEPHPRKQLENRHGWRLTIQTDGYVKGNLAIAMYNVHCMYMFFMYIIIITIQTDGYVKGDLAIAMYNVHCTYSSRTSSSSLIGSSLKFTDIIIHLHSRDTRAMASFGSS